MAGLLMQFNYSLQYLSLANIRGSGSRMKGGYLVGSEASLLNKMPVITSCPGFWLILGIWLLKALVEKKK